MGLRIDYRLALTSASVPIESLPNCPSTLPVLTKNPSRCRNLASTLGTSRPLSLSLAFAYESELGVRDGRWLAAVAGDDSAGPRGRPSPYGGTSMYRTVSATALQISITDAILLFLFFCFFFFFFFFVPAGNSFQGSAKFFKNKKARIIYYQVTRGERTLVIYNDTALKRTLEAAAD